MICWPGYLVLGRASTNCFAGKAGNFWLWKINLFDRLLIASRVIFGRFGVFSIGSKSGLSQAVGDGCVGLVLIIERRKLIYVPRGLLKRPVREVGVPTL